MLKTLVPLALGGSLGTVARWGLQRWIDGRLPASATGGAFPWGILVVNVSGCLVFGWLFARFEGRVWATEPLRLAVFTGFLGGYTTFSTFGWNTFELLRGGQAGLAFANAAASVVLGLAAVWAGFSLGR